jgi:hypothetical protein
MDIKEQNIHEFHHFMWSLMDGPSFHGGQPWGNVIQRFIWLKALQPDGEFYEATDLALDLTKLKYWVNSTALIHALQYWKDTNMDEIQ